MQKIRGAIQRVDDPYRVAVTAAPAFLGQKGMAGVMLTDELDDLGLGRMIDLADEIIASLGGDRQGFQAVQAADDDFGGRAGRADSDIEKRMHGKISSRNVFARAAARRRTDPAIVTD